MNNEVPVEPVLVLINQDDSVYFDRPWADYKAGFGSEETNYWLGLDSLHSLTSTGSYRLSVDMISWDNVTLWAHYDSFSVGPESGNYTLSVSGYDQSSTAGDSLIGNADTTHDGMMFSTIDNDNDRCPCHCAGVHKAGWWYNWCYEAQPTGTYHHGGVVDDTGIAWRSAPGYNQYYSFKTMFLIITPK